jgi:DNA-binding NarL/FixJ family response regulator
VAVSSALITVALAEDHRLVREGLRMLLQGEADLSVVGMAGDGAEAIELVTALRPSVLVLDLVLPTMNGLDVLRRVVADVPETRVVILSMHTDEWHVREALTAGAAGYVAKDADAAELLRAIRDAAAGRRYLSLPSRAQPLEPGTIPDPQAGTAILTPREREVFQLAALGRTAQQIARTLGMSPRTAETHRRNLMRKLSLRSQTDLVRYAIRVGAVPPDA